MLRVTDKLFVPIVVMLNVVMLNVVMQIVVMLNVFMLSVVKAKCCYAECHGGNFQPFQHSLTFVIKTRAYRSEAPSPFSCSPWHLPGLTHKQ